MAHSLLNLLFNNRGTEMVRIQYEFLPPLGKVPVVGELRDALGGCLVSQKEQSHGEHQLLDPPSAHPGMWPHSMAWLYIGGWRSVLEQLCCGYWTTGCVICRGPSYAQRLNHSGALSSHARHCENQNRLQGAKDQSTLYINMEMP